VKTIGIVGSRRRDSLEDLERCRMALKEVYEQGDRIVSGGCPCGGDRFAEVLARKLGCTIVIHHADWKRKGRSAGFQRNTLIAQDCDILIAVVASDRRGGTEDTIEKAEKLGKRIVIV